MCFLFTTVNPIRINRRYIKYAHAMRDIIAWAYCGGANITWFYANWVCCCFVIFYNNVCNESYPQSPKNSPHAILKKSVMR